MVSDLSEDYADVLSFAVTARFSLVAIKGRKEGKVVTGDQFLIHAVGDYITQSDWMAVNKTQRWFLAACHALVYSAPFWMLSPSLLAWLVILSTHYLIDRYRLARYVVWFKNYLAPPGSNPAWADVAKTFGYPADRPIWLAMWLMVIADNILHVTINGAALKWL